jgi:hypothetical protein
VDAILRDSSLQHLVRVNALQEARDALEAKLRLLGMFRLEVCLIPLPRRIVAVMYLSEHKPIASADCLCRLAQRICRLSMICKAS